MFFSLLLPTLGNRIYELNRLLESLSIQEFKSFEIVIVTQENHSEVEKLKDKWLDLDIKQIKIDKRGLSIARNSGLSHCNGKWIILSDDDCWYPNDALLILKKRIEEYNADILLTEIFDYEQKMIYKNYPDKSYRIKNKLDLMSKSSIEIAIRKDKIKYNFDLNLGLGAKFICGEEIDFLLNNYKNCRIFFSPDITVYHPKKNVKNPGQIKAKGYLYAKHYNILIGTLVCIRDLIKKKENNFKLFFEGYYEYSKRIT